MRNAVVGLVFAVLLAGNVAALVAWRHASGRGSGDGDIPALAARLEGIERRLSDLSEAVRRQESQLASTAGGVPPSSATTRVEEKLNEKIAEIEKRLAEASGR